MRAGNSLRIAVVWLSVPFGLFAVVGSAEARWFQTEATCNSCTPCHSFDDVLPEGHSRDGVETVESCVVCHSRENRSFALGFLVHRKHYALEAFAGDCWSCHSTEEEALFGLTGTTQGAGVEVSRDKPGHMSSYFKSWASSEYLDRRHSEQGVDCIDCHSSFFPDGPAPMGVCLDCHGSYPDLAEQTNQAEPNPHASHLGEIDCGHCHKFHEPSVLVCRQCH